jgi:hypothetical protein
LIFRKSTVPSFFTRNTPSTSFFFASPGAGVAAGLGGLLEVPLLSIGGQVS